MLERLTINLSENEKQALEIIATSEMRNLREQARFILRQEFERRGLLKSDPTSNKSRGQKKERGSDATN
jgi:hypothetical protein